MTQKKQEMRKIKWIIILFLLILIYLFFINPLITKINIDEFEKENKRLYWKEHVIIKNKLNGRVLYAYSDTLKLEKIGVSKLDNNSNSFSISYSNDTLNHKSDSLIFVHITHLKNKNDFNSIFFIDGEKIKDFLLLENLDMINGRNHVYSLSIREPGVREIKIEIENEIFNFNIYVE